MTRIITVPFRNEDEDLWRFIEETAGAPVSGTVIRDLLHAHKNATEAKKEARDPQDVI